MFERHQFFLDGWYTQKEDADSVCSWIDDLPGLRGAITIQNDRGTYGVLYLAEKAVYDNHEPCDWGQYFAL